jgi:hypothetical protein
MDISLSYPPYTVRRSCFAKHFLKQFQLLHRIHSTTTATAGAITISLRALPHTPLPAYFFPVMHLTTLLPTGSRGRQNGRMVVWNAE